MKKVCCYCDKDMGVVPGQPGTESDTTHGICPECYAEHSKLSGRILAQGPPCGLAPVKAFLYYLLLPDPEAK